jgi:radical SAM-linked protein
VTGPSDPGSLLGDAPQSAAAHPPLEPRQRWRITFSREAALGDEVPTGRDYVARWEEAVLLSGLPALTLASGRPRIALGAPLPSGCSADAELLEFWLVAVEQAWAVRARIETNLPAGHRLRGVESIWIGAPALSGQVAAADYEVTLAPGVDPDRLAHAVERLLAAGSVPRERLKGGVAKAFDLRPLVLDIEARGAALRMRTRIHPELGSGRPDEVVAALADELGANLQIEHIVRVRLLLVDELDR